MSEYLDNIKEQILDLKQPTALDLDLATGMVTYKGRELTYAELQWEFDQEEADIADLIYENRDLNSDIQQAWGSKPYFRDDRFYRKKPYKKLRGYPSEIEGAYNSVPIE